MLDKDVYSCVYAHSSFFGVTISYTALVKIAVSRLLGMFLRRDIIVHCYSIVGHVLTS